MQEYEDHFDLDDEFGSLDILTDSMKQPMESANDKPRRSTREKNPANRYGDNEYLAYHYTFMMKVASLWEPETLSEAVKDPRWIDAMN